MSSLSYAEPSVDALRAEAEANRTRLTGTVDELRTQVSDTATDIKERLSPAAIKTEVTQYVRDSRDQLWHSLEQKARANPLQAVAIGAALAYPALQIIRAMPAPLLLVGAGLLLARQTGNTEGEQLRAHAQQGAEVASQAFDSVTESARAGLHDARDQARGGIDAVKEHVSGAADALQERVMGVAEDAKAAASDALDSVTERAGDMMNQTRTAVSATWDQNPLLVAGIGLAIGAFIAAAFPATETEEKLFGDTSDALRRQAEGVAAKGIDAAKSAVEGVAAAAGEQGLTVDGLTSLGQELTDKAKAVAERGVEAALGEPKQKTTDQSFGTRSS